LLDGDGSLVFVAGARSLLALPRRRVAVLFLGELGHFGVAHLAVLRRGG